MTIKENTSTTGAKGGVKEKEEALDLRHLEEAAGEEAAEVSKGVTSTTAAELKMEPEVEVPPEARAWMKKQDAWLRHRLELYVGKLDAARAEARVLEAGTVTVGSYVGLDVLAYSPIQGTGPPPYEPHKIIAGGEWAVIWALVFVNPAVSIPSGFAIPPTVQLGGRGFRVRCEQVNLTNVSSGPGFTFVGTFPSTAPSMTWIPFYFQAPDPGANPWLMEANITVDITAPGQPWAAFATWHFDVDSDPGFLWVPPTPAGLQHDIPMRYLIYSES
ncbi:MAG TPA: hypothetical protein VK977_05325 [Actinomycetota bacterium]|nr:hypothetical protein [Actinomycetota bacterium]